MEHLLGCAERQHQGPTGQPCLRHESGSQDGERRETAEYRDTRQLTARQGVGG